MITHRPSPAYLFLCLLALAAWCLAWPENLLLAALSLGLTGLSYRLKTWTWRPDLKTFLVLLPLVLAFHYFVSYAHVEAQLSIYALRFVQAAQISMVCLIVLQWYTWRSPHFDWLLFSLGLLLLSSGISRHALEHKALFIWLVLSFTGTLFVFRVFPGFKTAYSAQSQPQTPELARYYLSMLAILFLTLTGSLLGLRGFELLDQRFNDMLARMLTEQVSDWGGFGGQTWLQGNHEVRLSERIALTVQAPRALEYWRGNILTYYQDGRWYPEETLQLRETGNPSAAKEKQTLQRHPLFADSHNSTPTHTSSAAQTRIQVQMHQHFNGILFTPAEARQLLVAAPARVYQNQYGLLRRELYETRHQYELLIGDSSQIPANFSEEIRQENLHIAPEIKAALLAEAHAITAQARSPLDKARALERWFQTHFTYSLRSQAVPMGVDPSVDFILNRRPAWCSWFASGMVLMLRSLDIPAHLVSGWRSMDYNLLSRSWVVKEKEAHDWVEVLDSEQGVWVRFDPTPPGQLAALTEAGMLLGWWQYIQEGLGLSLSHWREQLAQMSLRERLFWLQAQALKLLRSPFFYLGLGTLLVLNQLYKRRRNRPLHISPPPDLYLGASSTTRHCIAALETWLQSRQLAPLSLPLSAWYAQHQPELTAAEAQLLLTLLEILQALRFGPALPETPESSMPQANSVQHFEAVLQELWATQASLQP